MPLYYWLVRALKEQGLDELATNELHQAKQHLMEEEYSELLVSLSESAK